MPQASATMSTCAAIVTHQYGTFAASGILRASHLSPFVYLLSCKACLCQPAVHICCKLWKILCLNVSVPAACYSAHHATAAGRHAPAAGWAGSGGVVSGEWAASTKVSCCLGLGAGFWSSGRSCLPGTSVRTTVASTGGVGNKHEMSKVHSLNCVC